MVHFEKKNDMLLTLGVFFFLNRVAAVVVRAGRPPAANGARVEAEKTGGHF